MVGGESIFELSALAVEREMVGRDSDGELMGDGDCNRACC